MSGPTPQGDPTFWAAALKSTILHSLPSAHLPWFLPGDPHAQSILPGHRFMICKFTSSPPFVRGPKSTLGALWLFVAGHRAAWGSPGHKVTFHSPVSSLTLQTSDPFVVHLVPHAHVFVLQLVLCLLSAVAPDLLWKRRPVFAGARRLGCARWRQYRG